MRLIQQQDEHMPPKFLNPNWLLSDYSRSSFNDSSSNRNRPLLLFEVFKDENEEYTELCIIQVKIIHFYFLYFEQVLIIYLRYFSVRWKGLLQ